MRPRLHCALLRFGWLVALLLSAQHGALTHALWHAGQNLPAQHRGQIIAGDIHHPAVPEAAGLCVFDAAFGQVLGAAPAAHYRHQARTSAGAAPEHAEPLAVVRQTLLPHSRGPPVLL